jgi:murein DD-endopeptidase MepM/ murein hydrolase activator NlpD
VKLRVRLSRSSFAAVLIGTLAGCATSRGSSWEEEQGGLVLHTKARAAEPTPRVARPKRATRSVDNELQLELLRFVSRRHEVVEQYSASDRWPPAMEAIWLDLLARLDSGLASPDAAPTKRLLIQTRVTTEAELELTERRFGATPERVRTHADRVFALVAMHMGRARTPEERARASAKGELEWPVAPVIVSSGFGYRRDPVQEEIRFHSGIDLAGRSGDLISAAGPGRVIHSGWLGGYGRAVIVQHPGGIQTLYGHLARVLIPLGAEVDPGSPLGFMGSSGRSTGPHLHFEVRREGMAIDPHEVIGMHIARLVEESG